MSQPDTRQLAECEFVQRGDHYDCAHAAGGRGSPLADWCKPCLGEAGTGQPRHHRPGGTALLSVATRVSMDDYAAFLERKAHLSDRDGFEPIWLPDFLFPFQRDLVEWAVWKGRAAVFADCGLGKTPMQLVWAENVRRHTGKPVLVLTPLAVGFQTEGEAEKFGIDAAICRNPDQSSLLPAEIVVTNYERLHLFDPYAFGGVVCDESSAIKAFDGVRRKMVTDFVRKHRYRLLCTATAAPNDYIELGTSSEALGELGYMDMLGRFFTNKDRTGNMRTRRFVGKRDAPQWRFKGHAEEPFWRWVSSWARALRRPSDLGHADDQFELPPLETRQHVVVARAPREGLLFDLPANGIREEREEARRTIEERCELASDLVADADSAVVWCQLNAESERLASLIDGAAEVSGSDDPDAKEEKLLAFSRGQIRVLVTKPIIGAWGLNWQHCARMTYFPSHSYEQWYQAVRRSWRYGQERPVLVDLVTTEGGENALRNLERKRRQAERMFERLVAHMRDALQIGTAESFPDAVEVPAWLR